MNPLLLARSLRIYPISYAEDHQIRSALSAAITPRFLARLKPFSHTHYALCAHSPTKQMRGDYYVSGRFYGIFYSLLLVRIHYYVTSSNTVVRNERGRSRKTQCLGQNAVPWAKRSALGKTQCLGQNASFIPLDNSPFQARILKFISRFGLERVKPPLHLFDFLL
jgi:hypothetical protein